MLTAGEVLLVYILRYILCFHAYRFLVLQSWGRMNAGIQQDRQKESVRHVQFTEHACKEGGRGRA